MTQTVQQIEKLPTGIPGFDAITNGGLPKNRTTLVVGGPGSGKTVFAIQTLVNGARMWGEPGIFVAFEENSKQLITNASTFGWNLPELQEKKLFFLDAHLTPEVLTMGEFDLIPMLALLKAQAEEMGAKRIVFDGIDVLLALLDSPVAERREIYRLHYWLQESGMTSMLTAKVESSDTMAIHRYSFLQFMADAVVQFRQHREGRVTLRGVSVPKFRGSGHSGHEASVVISSRGMEVSSFTGKELEYEATTERVTSGIPRLDTMLGGGYYRGAAVLISGSPGTAKTTLAGLFTEAACRRGERSLFISLDEGSDAIIRNLKSVSIDLEPYVKSGLLQFYSVRTGAFNAEEHFIHFERLMEQYEPRIMVIDPLSALANISSVTLGGEMGPRLIDLARSRGATLLATSLLSSADNAQETTPSEISTIADTWIHLSYVIRAGERNRALTIIKSRGSGHSNQVRELVLRNEGVTLADVYTAGGEVLMGTARWERENEDRTREIQARQAIEQRGREIEQRQAEIRARRELLDKEAQAAEAELRALRSTSQAREERQESGQEELLRLRRADVNIPKASKGKAGKPKGDAVSRPEAQRRGRGRRG